MIDIEAIRARAEAATPGPWSGQEDKGVAPVFETGCGCCTSSSLSKNDADFIAHAREDIPALLAEIDRLKAEIEAR